MQSFNPFIIIILFFLYSCNTTTESYSNENNISLMIEHPNTKQFEWMLNNYKEGFLTDEEHFYIAGDTLVLDQAYFITENSNDTVSLFFCKHQNDAIKIAKNHYANNPYGVNGAVLFVIQSNDEYRTNDLLGWFSGEE